MMFARPNQPSRATKRAADAAANSPHGLINLVRLVKALEETEEEEEELGAVEQQRRIENISYAQALYDSLRERNEQSSSSSTLDEIQRSLKDIQAKSAPVENSNGHLHQERAVALPGPSKTTSATVNESEHLPSPPLISTMSASTGPRQRRKAPTVEEYLRTRSREDLADGESGLLPLKTIPVANSPSDSPGNSRDRLLAGASGALGSSQLHEELGGQLADMSHRLKLNALHFANSLEDEKSLLEIGQDVLEKNLAGTRSSKTNLGRVSSKSRGTTCMTLGIVILVLVIFIWTYMLIRFT